jgi:hypothetical protein
VLVSRRAAWHAFTMLQMNVLALAGVVLDTEGRPGHRPPTNPTPIYSFGLLGQQRVQAVLWPYGMDEGTDPETRRHWALGHRAPRGSPCYGGSRRVGDFPRRGPDSKRRARPRRAGPMLGGTDRGQEQQSTQRGAEQSEERHELKAAAVSCATGRAEPIGAGRARLFATLHPQSPHFFVLYVHPQTVYARGSPSFLLASTCRVPRDRRAGSRPFFRVTTRAGRCGQPRGRGGECAAHPAAQNTEQEEQTRERRPRTRDNFAHKKKHWKAAKRQGSGKEQLTA